MDKPIHKILFVCHGNICRSPMAEFIMKDLVRKAGMSDSFVIDSAAVSYEEQGNGIYPPARRTLSSHCIPFSDHRAHRVDDDEASAYDIIIIMDSSNRHLISRLLSAANMAKVRMMMEYAPGSPSRDVSDPWYTGDFEETFNDIMSGCKGLLSSLCDE